ncbi:hypothetical protein [Pseudomaricurvus sp.]|uniref:hypothetical protein n=1 Tax=Pseudomaricurvus sp. TaxID=2004510 RepID=UPI003F6B1B29
MKRTLVISAMILMSALVAGGCTSAKKIGKEIGHTTRDVTRDIGHATRDAAKEVDQAVDEAITDDL